MTASQHDRTTLPASVLVTGAEGGLGRRTMRALASLPLVRGLDRGSGSQIVTDLTDPPVVWQHHLEGVEVLIHLAGEPSHKASREQVERDNIGMTRAVLRAAAEARVARVIFASSCHVLAGHRYRLAQFTPDTPPCPISPYGWSKRAGEEDGRLWAAETGGTFLALRIGLCPREGNVHFSRAGLSRWMQAKWLTGEDYAQAILRATTAEVTGFHVMTICSAVAGSPWDLSAARDIIGYHPSPLHAPRVGMALRLAELRDSLRHRLTGGPAPYS